MHMPLYATQTRRTAGNITFLLLSFPFGLLSFLIIVIGFAVGVGTLIIWIGLPILFVTLVAIRGMAQIERRIASTLLQVPLPSQIHRNDAPRQGILRQFASVLRDPLTWTSTIYMILKFPLGIISFTLALVLPIVAISVTALPVAYLINLLVNGILLKNGIQSTGIIIPYFIEVRTQFDLVMFARSFIGVPIGLAFWFATLYLLNGLALLWGEMVRALLSSGGEVDMPKSDQQYASPIPQEGLHALASRENND